MGEIVTLAAVVAKLRAVPTIKDVEVRPVAPNEHSAFGSIYIIGRPHNEDVLGAICAALNLSEDGQPIAEQLHSFFEMIDDMAAIHAHELKAKTN